MSFIAYSTLSAKEVRRFSKIWVQTLLPPVMTSVLYFLVFGTFLGAEKGAEYQAFLAPGLIMMAIINNAFANTVSSFFQAKMLKHLEELLVSSMSPLVMLLGFLTGGVVRALLVGVGVLGVSLFFIPFSVFSFGWMFFFWIGTAILFSLLGLLNAIYAKTFDDISIIPTFVLTPMIYLGGVFYSIHLLSGIWKTLSFYNPLLYIIDGFRYSLLGVSDIALWKSATLLLVITVFCFALVYFLLKTGKNIRN